MRSIRIFAAAALFALAAPALAAPVHVLTNEAKQGFLNGTFVTGDSFRMEVLSSASTNTAANATNWASLSGGAACTGTCTPTPPGSGTYAIAAVSTAGWALDTRSIAGAYCWDFATKVYSIASATITGDAVAIFDATANKVIAILCTDNNSTASHTCATDVTSTNGTWQVTLASNLICVTRTEDGTDVELVGFQSENEAQVALSERMYKHMVAGVLP